MHPPSEFNNTKNNNNDNYVEEPAEDGATNDNDNDNIENIDDYMNYLWKSDFCPVASLLLKRVEQLKLQNQ